MSVSMPVGQQYSVAMLRRGMDVQKQQGDGAISLIEQAGEAAPAAARPEGSKGHLLRTIA